MPFLQIRITTLILFIPDGSLCDMVMHTGYFVPISAWHTVVAYLHYYKSSTNTLPSMLEGWGMIHAKVYRGDQR